MNSKILVIDDEEALCEILRYNLAREGYDVDTATSAEQALEMDLSVYDLVIADIMMEKLSGFDFARRVRTNPAIEHLPIIFCTALTGEYDMVMGLNIGADDYITKPFMLSEVKARVRAVLRRSRVSRPQGGQQQRPLQQLPPESDYELPTVYKTLVVDNNNKTCSVDGEQVPLTRTEFGILTFFLTHPGRIYSREDIIRQVWAPDVVVTNRTIDTNILRLRRKIGPYGRNIVTRTGFGYGFKKEED